MIENLPGYVSIVFILTTFLAVGFLFYAVKQTVFETVAAKILLFLLPFWLFFQAVLSIGGFYLQTDAVPPRLMLTGFFPALLLIIFYFVFARKTFVERLPLRTLTLLHVVRVPVEIVLWQLYGQKLIPQLMTFEGRNFDILAGLTAPLVAWLAFRNGRVNRPLLLGWNLLALVLVLNIVVNAVLSFPFPLQQFAFDQPNRALLYFPFIWLPVIVVPIVFFAHFVSLWQLFKQKRDR